MSKAVTAEWQHLRSCSRLLASFLILLSISSPTKAQRNNLDLAQSISASLKLRTALDLPLAEPTSDKLAVDRGSPVYLNLEDRLFFDKDKRDINSSEAASSLPPRKSFGLLTIDNADRGENKMYCSMRCRCAGAPSGVQGARRVPGTW